MVVNNSFINNNINKLDLNLAELFESSNEIYILVSFVKVSGVERLTELLSSCPGLEKKKIRVLTSTYMCITQPYAIDKLQKLIGFNNQIKIEYNLTNYNSSLHAKAWIFSGAQESDISFIIGSSNISALAISSGKEWNIRVDNDSENHRVAKSEFEILWHSPAFRRFNLNELLEYYKENKENVQKSISSLNVYSGLYDYQQDIVNKAYDRYGKGESKMIIISATGTGKTNMAIEIYKKIIKEGKYSKLVYIAEKDEILKSNLQQFRSLLGNKSFGSIISSNTRLSKDFSSNDGNIFINLKTLAKNFSKYDDNPDSTIYIVDECHHSAANSYHELLSGISKSSLLIGLTATPDRYDGKDILAYFGGKNGIVEDLRLHKALELNLLSPFVYYAVSNNNLEYSDASKESLILSNFKNYVKGNIKYICYEIELKIDPYSSKSILFCQNKEMAEFLKIEIENYFRAKYKYFNVRTILSSTESSSRVRIFDDFKNGNINLLIAVDVLNEGIDVPDIDVVIFLRPTQSPVIFLQQLGRGLRKSINKFEVAVLDFAQNYNHSYDTLKHYGQIDESLPKQIVKQISTGGKPFSVNGCLYILSKIQNEHIISNIKKIGLEKGGIADYISSYGIEYIDIFGSNYESTDINSIISNFSISIEGIYQDKGSVYSWVNGKNSKDPRVMNLLSEAYNFSKVNDTKRLSEYQKLCDNISGFDPHNRYHRMFFSNLFRRNFLGSNESLSKSGRTVLSKYVSVPIFDWDDLINFLIDEPVVLQEVAKVLVYACKNNIFVSTNYKGSLAENALYTSDELSGFMENKKRFLPATQYPSQDEGISVSDDLSEHYLRVYSISKNYGILKNRFMKSGMSFKFTMPNTWAFLQNNYSGKYSQNFQNNMTSNQIYFFIDSGLDNNINKMKIFYFTNSKSMILYNSNPVEFEIQLPNNVISTLV